MSFLAKRLSWISGKNIHALQMLALDRVVEAPSDAGFEYVATDFSAGLAIALQRYHTGEVRGGPTGRTPTHDVPDAPRHGLTDESRRIRWD